MFEVFWREGLLAYDAVKGIDWTWLSLDGLGAERPRPTWRRKQHLCLDEGYDSAEPRRLAAASGFTLRLRTRGEEAKACRDRS